MNRKPWAVLIFGFAVLLGGSSAAVAQPLSSFAVLGGSTVTNTSTPTIVTGNLGVSPGSSVTGFPPGSVVAGSIHAADTAAAQAQTDLTTVYNNLASAPCNADLSGQDLGGKTLTPGVYCYSTSAQLTGTLILDGQGNSNATFIFKMGSSLTTASASSVQLTNGASSCGVFWQVGSSATLGTGSTLAGSIVALSSITLNTGSNVSGRVLARNGAVTLDNNQVTVCSGGGFGSSPPVVSVPTLSGWALLALTGLLVFFGLAVMRRRVSL
jgi:type VI secretion system secreted protein VgrG